MVSPRYVLTTFRESFPTSPITMCVANNPALRVYRDAEGMYPAASRLHQFDIGYYELFDALKVAALGCGDSIVFNDVQAA